MPIHRNSQRLVDALRFESSPSSASQDSRHKSSKGKKRSLRKPSPLLNFGTIASLVLFTITVFC